MTPTEVHALLAYASAIDPSIRRNDPDERRLQAAAWHTLLADVDPDTAKAAVERHYAVPGADALMPADVLGRRALGEDPDRLPYYVPFREQGYTRPELSA
jgi:hypothetical protein